MSMLAPGNILISLFAAGSLSYLVYKIKAPFKSHSFNTFAYIILLLIVYALIGKSIRLLCLCGESNIRSESVLLLRRQGLDRLQNSRVPRDLSVH
jgi:hypothetical protein